MTEIELFIVCTVLSELVTGITITHCIVLSQSLTSNLSRGCNMLLNLVLCIMLYVFKCLFCQGTLIKKCEVYTVVILTLLCSKKVKIVRVKH